LINFESFFGRLVAGLDWLAGWLSWLAGWLSWLSWLAGWLSWLAGCDMTPGPGMTLTAHFLITNEHFLLLCLKPYYFEEGCLPEVAQPASHPAVAQPASQPGHTQTQPRPTQPSPVQPIQC